MKYKTQIEPEAELDIQEAITWYNNKQKGLGKKFHNEVKKCFNHLRINPFFRIRYNDVRVFLLKNILI